MLTGLAEYDIVLSDLDVFLEVGNSEAIVKAVEAGYGVSFVSRLAAAWALDRGSVVEVPVVGFDLRRNVYLIRPERQVTNRAIDAYWGFVHDPSNADLLRIAEN
jgi:DNA-binding transcriptional LysR family regulator